MNEYHQTLHMESLKVTFSPFTEVANRIHYCKPLSVTMYTELLIHHKTFSCTKAYLKHHINEFVQNSESTPIHKAEDKTSKKTATQDRSKY
jgi:hypothetical protein